MYEYRRLIGALLDPRRNESRRLVDRIKCTGACFALMVWHWLPFVVQAWFGADYSR